MKPSLLESIELKNRGARLIALRAELYSDSFTPIEVLKALRKTSDSVFLLESAENDMRSGRWTFLGYDPMFELVVDERGIVVRENGTEKTIRENNPIAFIQGLIKNRFKMLDQDGFPPFSGGFVGYFAYDAVKCAEPSLSRYLPPCDEPDIDLMIFRTFLSFDSYRKKLHVITLLSADNLEKEYEEGIKRINDTVNLIKRGGKAYFPPLELKSKFSQYLSDEEYGELVNKAKKHITDGDIFQIFLSNIFEADAKGSLFDAYRVLRSSNPSPYMFYYGGKEIEIAGSSPETLLKVQKNKMKTYPLAGTRARGKTDEEDQALEQELLNDEKELSEHDMLVDLGRNDLGRVAKDGSVCVINHRSVLRFSHVMHIASEVEAELKENEDALSALFSLLPAGTLSGAPKIKACELIAKLEKRRRGLYGGAFGYLTFTGNLDAAIAIRLCYMKCDKLRIQAGAGIVYDSSPDKEAEECRRKTGAAIDAVIASQGGIYDIAN